VELNKELVEELLREKLGIDKGQYEELEEISFEGGLTSGDSDWLDMVPPQSKSIIPEDYRVLVAPTLMFDFETEPATCIFYKDDELYAICLVDEEGIVHKFSLI
jgi:hypothetical protein